MSHLDHQLSAYLDGELSTDERAGVLRHLDDCAGCRTELDRLAEIRGKVRSLPAVEVPAGVLPEPSEVAAVGSRWSPSPMGMVAAALVVVTGVLAVMAVSQDDPVASGELSVLLASYSSAGSQVAAMAPATVSTEETERSHAELPGVVAGIPRTDVRGLDEAAVVGYYTDGETSFALLSSYRPLDVSSLEASAVDGPGGEYLRVEGDESVMYVWRSGTRWMALLGVMPDASLERVLADLPPPHEPGLLARMGSWIGD